MDPTRLNEFLRDYDVFRFSDGLSYHIKVKRGDLNGYVLTMGSPERFLKAINFLNDVKTMNTNRGLLTANGYYCDVPITLYCTGMGPASAEIAFTEILFNIDFSSFPKPTIIRAGTAGSLNRCVDVGNIVIETGIVRFEGVSYKIAPEGFPATTDILTTIILIEAAYRMNLSDKVWIGKSLCKDALYVVEEPYKHSAIPSKILDTLKAFENLGVLAMSMESSPIAILVDMYNEILRRYSLPIKVSFGSALLIVSPYSLDKAPSLGFVLSEKNEETLIKMCLEALKKKYAIDTSSDSQVLEWLDCNMVTKLLLKRCLS